MRITIRQGYNGVVHVTGLGKLSGVFQPGRKTFTGAKDKYGANRCLTASAVKRYFGAADQLQVPGDLVMLDDDKGLFDRVSPVDLYQYGRKCYAIITVPLRVLSQFAKLMEGK